MSSDDVSMKPMLGALVQEAVLLAIVDSVALPTDETGGLEALTASLDRNAARREALRADVFLLTDEEWASIDPKAQAQNVACRLLGPGGWTVRGVYGGNASPGELLEATFQRPYSGPLDELRSALEASGFVLEDESQEIPDGVGEDMVDDPEA